MEHNKTFIMPLKFEMGVSARAHVQLSNTHHTKGKELYVIFKKRVRGFHQVSKREKTFENTRLQTEWFYCFLLFSSFWCEG